MVLAVTMAISQMVKYHGSGNRKMKTMVSNYVPWWIGDDLPLMGWPPGIDGWPIQNDAGGFGV
jgi:hypothetical protein